MADFNVDMSFSEEEISAMLVEYENDYHTGMDIDVMFETYLYDYLVNASSMRYGITGQENNKFVGSGYLRFMCKAILVEG